MATFGKQSIENKLTCHLDLQAILDEAIKHYDFKIICGHRGEDEQNQAYRMGRSKVRWPNSKHNSIPSKAADCAPYPIDWEDLERFNEMAIHIKTAADKLGAEIRWGGDWKMKDYPHVELV